MSLLGTSLVMLEAAEPASPGAGRVAVYAGTDGRLHTKDSAGVVVTPAACTVLPFSAGGVLSVGTGRFVLYNDSGRTWTILAVRASVDTAPTGSGIIIDVRKGATSIFGDPGGRPTIAAGTKTAKSTAMSTTTVDDGEYLAVDIDQVGSTVAGSDLTVQVTVV